MLYGNIWKKSKFFDFKGTRLAVYSRGYILAQRSLVYLPYKHYYKKFEDNGWENVPAGKPLLFAISHRNAFMDSLSIANVHNTQVWQLARGDAFKQPIMRRLFYYFHMLPIWRERDGVDTRTSNMPTFEACADILGNNGMVGIYPEGNCINERHIRPLKKGICRIAFQTMVKYNWEIDLFIIPTGVSYKNAESFKGTQLINFGIPINVKDYKNIYLQSNSNAINRLKEDVESRMKDTVVHIPRGLHHENIDRLSVLLGRSLRIEKGMNDTLSNELNCEQDAVKQLIQLESEKPAIFAEAVHIEKAFSNELEKAGLSLRDVDKEEYSISSLGLSGLIHLFSLPLLLVGWLTHIIPITIVEKLVKKMAGQSIFISSLRYAFGLGVFLIYYTLIFITLLLVLPVWWWAFPSIVLLPILGNLAWFVYDGISKWFKLISIKPWKRNGPYQKLRKYLIELKGKLPV